MNDNGLLQLSISTVLRNKQNAIISANDFSPRQIGHFIDDVGQTQTLTVKDARQITYEDLERLCNRASEGKIFFDFSEK